MKKLAMLLTLALMLMLVCTVDAATINLVSGSVPIGQSDPNITVEGMAANIGGVSYPAASVSLQQALVIQKNHDWTTLDGSQWVGVNNGELHSPAGGYVYRTGFQLPADFNQATINVTTTCDNFGEVYLNGNWLGSMVEEPPSTFTRLFSFSNSNQAAFRAGSNTLEFRIANSSMPSGWTNPTGLVFSAEISYVPEPSSLLILVSGIGVFSGLVRRKRASSVEQE